MQGVNTDLIKFAYVTQRKNDNKNNKINLNNTSLRI